MNKHQIGIIGAGGFTGKELLKILSLHPYIKISYITSDVYATKKLGSVFSTLKLEILDLVFSTNPKIESDIPSNLDVIFLACPDTVAMQWLPFLLKRNILVIDLGGAFRLPNYNDFEKYYNILHTAKNELSHAVYGLSELYKDKIKGSKLIANPGCYPTSVLIPLGLCMEAIETSLVSIIIDAKSGTSGAGGRKEKDEISFSNVYENFRAYRVENHQHTPEIKEYLCQFSNLKEKIRNLPFKFTPHLLPVFRGILSTTYISVDESFQESKFIQIVESKVKELKFIRFHKDPNQIQLSLVQNTNFLDFSYYFDSSNRIIVIISVIDNLIKGAAGQAVQNMNIALNIDETIGLL